MNKKLLIGIILLFVGIVAFVLFFNMNKSSGPVGTSENLVLFYSDSCPHCQNVEKFLEENKVLDKVSYVRKSVDNNSANISELQKRAAACGLSDSIGIPFLWDSSNSKCLMGDADIIKFFQEKIK